MNPTLVALAHGSRDPRSAATVAALVDQVRRRRPELDVRPAFLDLSAPRLDAVLDGVGDGAPGAVVVPLLLGSAYHARVDVPAEVRAVTGVRPRLRATIAQILGPVATPGDQADAEGLQRAALRRLAAVGVDPDDRDTGVVLAAAGSSRPTANRAVAAMAARLAEPTRWVGVAPAFASATRPTVPAAIERLRRAGARRIAVASWFLAPGLLPDKVARLAVDTHPAAVVAEPLGDDVEVAQLVVQRYEAALDLSSSRDCAELAS